MAQAELPRIGRYELVAGIASGGMGSVVLARLAGSGGFQRLVAIKLMHRQFAEDPEFVEMLLDEARIAARIHHPNAVSIHEVTPSDAHGYYLVMDFVDGFPLSQVLARLAGAPVRQRFRVVNRVALDALAGLHAAHTLVDDYGELLRVVHRDVSPQNVLVGVDGIARVTDFGIAKASHRIAQTRVGQVKGKLTYMSPEQLRGEDVDARSDVWAMGVLLWEGLSLQRLFKPRTPVDIPRLVLREPLRPLADAEPATPPELQAVCARALERELARRFPSARDMALALERAARAHDLVADAHEVGEWVSATFATELAERRAAVRRAASDTILSSHAPEMAGFLEEGAQAAGAPPPPGAAPNGDGGDHTRTGLATASDPALAEDSADPTAVVPLDLVPTTHFRMTNAPPVLAAAVAEYEANLSQRDHAAPGAAPHAAHAAHAPPAPAPSGAFGPAPSTAGALPAAPRRDDGFDAVPTRVATSASNPGPAPPAAAWPQGFAPPAPPQTAYAPPDALGPPGAPYAPAAAAAAAYAPGYVPRPLAAPAPGPRWALALVVLVLIAGLAFVGAYLVTRVVR